MSQNHPTSHRELPAGPLLRKETSSLDAVRGDISKSNLVFAKGGLVCYGGKRWNKADNHSKASKEVEPYCAPEAAPSDRFSTFFDCIFAESGTSSDRHSLSNIFYAVWLDW